MEKIPSHERKPWEGVGKNSSPHLKQKPWGESAKIPPLAETLEGESGKNPTPNSRNPGGGGGIFPDSPQGFH